MEGSREVASLISILLVLLYQRFSLVLSMQLFVLRRSRRRRLRLRFLRTVKLLFASWTNVDVDGLQLELPEVFGHFQGRSSGFNSYWMTERWIIDGGKTFESLGLRSSISARLLGLFSGRRQNTRCNSCWEESKRKFMEAGNGRVLSLMWPGIRPGILSTSKVIL